ncbi:MAG TPA: ISKra4 family transposase, partial [Streptosporangiaceae bacterium]|nr:ISKra4 family transposase [Streptosporangiaceae bacterium]
QSGHGADQSGHGADQSGHGAEQSGGGAEWAGPARRYLESVVGWLGGPEASAAGHGELEARLQVHSREQYRLLLQGHLDERARLELRRSGVTGSDGVLRPRVENGHRRGLTTVFGSVTVTRKAYRAVPGITAADTATDVDGTACPGASDALPGSEAEPLPEPMPKGTATTTGAMTTAATTGTASEAPVSVPPVQNLCPADAVLNLPSGRHSAGLARLAAVEAARGSFADARAAIERASGVRLGKRQVEGLARAAAVDTEAFYAARQPQPRPDRVLGLQADGKGIVMRPDSLRPGTAARAERASAKLATRLSPGEKHGRKRMAEIVAVYDLDPAPRTVADIIPTRRRPSQARPARRPGPVVTGKWLAANLTDDIPAVIAAMFDEAERRDPAHERSWVALVDGNRQQIDTIREQAALRGVTVTIVIDFVHVLEYLWKAAWTLFYPGDRDAETWVADRARTILTGRAVDAAATIRHQADEAGFRGRERAGADEAAAYLTRKAPYLNYATALANGWQIATGIIEGAARHLIKDRMDITGARWSTPGAQAILRLRAVIANGDFDEYWQWHQQQELRRNHLDRYQKLDLAA